MIEAEVADILKVRRGALGISIELGPPSWPGWSNLLFVVRRSARTTSETVLSMMGTRRSSIRHGVQCVQPVQPHSCSMAENIIVLSAMLQEGDSHDKL